MVRMGMGMGMGMAWAVEQSSLLPASLTPGSGAGLRHRCNARQKTKAT